MSTTDTNHNTIDPDDTTSWGEAVERAAASIADATWGVPCWYRGAANAALTAALELDPRDTQHRLSLYHADDE